MRNIPVNRVESACSTGHEALRNACFAVACGMYDIALAVGVEKLKDTGGLPRGRLLSLQQGIFIFMVIAAEMQTGQQQQLFAERTLLRSLGQTRFMSKV